MYTPQMLIEHCPQLAKHSKIWVAFSGGLDSTVLLYSLYTIKKESLVDLPLSVLHVNHNLMSGSKKWQIHCEKMCQNLNLSMTTININIHHHKGESLENLARKARYDAFREYIDKNECLLTAHHADDQVETVLLRLFRGSGIRGLGAIKHKIPFSKGDLIRPLLNFSRTELKEYAQKNNLSWIDDPSNKDDRFDRNYLRNQVMPSIKKRWPAIIATIPRSAKHCSNTERLINEIAIDDYSLCFIDDMALSASQLKLLSRERIRNVIRYHLVKKSFALPSTKKMTQIIKEVIYSKYDKVPNVGWHHYCARRYNDKIFFMVEPKKINTQDLKLSYSLGGSLQLPHKLGTVCATSIVGGGIKLSTGEQLTISFRQGGERIKPYNFSHTKSLKKLFNEWQVPPWDRNKIPLLYCANELVAVIGFTISTKYYAKDDQEGWEISVVR